MPDRDVEEGEIDWFGSPHTLVLLSVLLELELMLLMLFGVSGNEPILF